MPSPRRVADHSDATGASDTLRLGLIGSGGRGSGPAQAFAEIAQIAYVCDPDGRSGGESRRRSELSKLLVISAACWMTKPSMAL